MSTNYSKEAFLKFLDYVSDKGLIKFQTVRGWRSAALKLMANLSEAEEGDIRTVDLDLAVHRTANHDSVSVSPESLNTYRNRVVLAIQEFVSWRDDPATYKPRRLNGKSRARPSNERVTPQERLSKGAPKTSEKRGAETMASSGLTLSFPLRSDFLAQVVIPRDLTAIEARRLGAFLLTIAVDYQPE
ncbi:MAG: hypothetical protein KME11_08375 [Timaviella obliquedivisa GSE-PSE-MK23-08B]|jgi:hypothetical protein|nr:hypothetical protein [Timaviella obliquedivisa GSE-PSE-MK23-08B]